MSGMKKTREKVLEAVVLARDEALVKLGKDAETRQEARVSTVRNRKVGKVAMAVAVAGGAVAAGVMAVKAYRGKNGKTVKDVVKDVKKKAAEKLH